MHVEWYGQSAFTLDGDGGDGLHRPVRRHVGGWPSAGIEFGLPGDRRADGATCCSSPTSTATTTGSRRSAASRRCCARPPGTLESPLGEVVAVASEHDDVAGTERGPNTIFVFDARRPARRPLRRLRPGGAARRAGARRLGGVDLLFVPVGGGPTIGGAAGGGDRRALGAALGRADALPHRARSTSSRPRRSSSTRCRRSSGSTRQSSTPPTCRRRRPLASSRAPVDVPALWRLARSAARRRRRRGRWRGRRARGVVGSGSSWGAVAVAALQGQFDQVVGEPGVLRQERAVEVGADHVVAPDALEAVAAVVAEAVALTTRPSGRAPGPR